ncbi:MAG: collagen-like protein [Bacteroidales bacterium]|nr:collagen-like protein [Bacteroidales bacterium]
MKKIKLLPFYAMLLMLAVITAVSCTKEGPAGPAGANGTNGTDGEDGINGQDGTATCIQCHDNSQVMFAKINQWEHSIHATGGNYERNGTDCAPCHTSQGFLERMANGSMVTEEAIANPNPVNCYTCHDIHKTYTPSDWALLYTGAVDYWHNPTKAITEDFEKGNLCSNCHQSRVVTPWPVVGSTDTYTITSYRYGPHHGPMANLLGGFGGYEISGTYTFSDSPHTTIQDGCVACHMADAFGVELGGHVMNVGYEGTLNESGCVSCHPDGIEDETVAMQEEIHALLDSLGAKLMDMSIMDNTGYLLGDDGVNRASSSNPANLTANEAGIFFNYKFVEEDRSGGVHNYKYARAILTNSLEAL